MVGAKWTIVEGIFTVYMGVDFGWVSHRTHFSRGWLNGTEENNQLMRNRFRRRHALPSCANIFILFIHVDREPKEQTKIKIMCDIKF